MSRFVVLTVLASAAFLVFAGHAPGQEIRLEPVEKAHGDGKFLQQDHAYRITVIEKAGEDPAGERRALPNITITAVFRPGTKIEEKQVLGDTNARGELLWTPREAGLVLLDATGRGDEKPLATRSVAVQYGSFPGSGLAIALVVGFLYFGVGGYLVGSLARRPRHDPYESQAS